MAGAVESERMVPLLVEEERERQSDWLAAGRELVERLAVVPNVVYPQNGQCPVLTLETIMKW